MAMTNPTMLQFDCSDFSQLAGVQIQVFDAGSVMVRNVFYGVGEVTIDSTGRVSVPLRFKATNGLPHGSYTMKVAEVSPTDMGLFSDALMFSIGYIPNVPTNVTLS